MTAISHGWEVQTTMTSWHSPGSLFNIGHRMALPLFDGRLITIQEKVDGSFFAFGVFDGVLKCRSRNNEINVDAPETLFKAAVETAKALAPALNEGWTYRGEYLAKPRHNGLAYNRVPKQHVILFDIAFAEESFANYLTLQVEAARLDLEVVPEFYIGPLTDPGFLKTYLDRESILGGQLIEGVVVKPVEQVLFTTENKRVVGKYVSEAFREVQKGHWKTDNPGKSEILDEIGSTLGTPARWQKAILRLREAGQYTGTPADIGPLIKSIQSDVVKEEKEDIAQKLFSWAWKKQLSRACTSGFPEWYKQRLIDEAFADPSPEDHALHSLGDS
jgi:hypothetical protein